MSKPNLFNYATSELSQDAMICWMTDWINQRNDQSMRDLAFEFLNAFLKLHNTVITLNEFISLEIRKQYENIDVLLKLVTLNKIIYILIEDKTGTTEHSGQLQRYYNIVSKIAEHEKLPYQIIGIYFKTRFIYDYEIDRIQEINK
jgi:hypothetical protein